MRGMFGAFTKNRTTLQHIESRLEAIETSIHGRGPVCGQVIHAADLGLFSLQTFSNHSLPYSSSPLIARDYFITYDGAFYNDYLAYQDGYGHSEYITKAVESDGWKSLRILDGEFAVSLYDAGAQTLYLATDPFATKPLYYQLMSDGCLYSSYRTTIRACEQDGPIHQAPPNTLLTISTKNGSLTAQETLRPFDRANATTTTFSQWTDAWKAAICKRTFGQNGKVAINRDFWEDVELITMELEYHDIPYIDTTNKPLSQLECQLMREMLEVICDPFFVKELDSRTATYKHVDGRSTSKYIQLAAWMKTLLKQDASMHFADCRHADKDLHLTLSAIERISGVFGIEARYPLLDWDVVQEYFYLAPTFLQKNPLTPITNRYQQLSLVH